RNLLCFFAKMLVRQTSVCRYQSLIVRLRQTEVCRTSKKVKTDSRRASVCCQPWVRGRNPTVREGAIGESVKRSTLPYGRVSATRAAAFSRHSRHRQPR